MRELLNVTAPTGKTYSESGPGPKNLVRGDLSFGFFGLMQPGEFVTVQDLAAACGLTLDAAIPETPVWLKYVEKGIIKYVPVTYIYLSFTWQQLYNAGAVYGDDAEGITPRYPTSQAAVKQSARITVAGSKLKIRLPGKGEADPCTVSATSSSPTALGAIATCDQYEWTRMARRLFSGAHACFAESWKVVKPVNSRESICIQSYTRSGSGTNAYVLNIVPPTDFNSTVAAGTFKVHTSNSKLARMPWSPLLELDQPALT